MNEPLPIRHNHNNNHHNGEQTTIKNSTLVNLHMHMVCQK
jgi:hypothetical protein